VKKFFDRQKEQRENTVRWPKLKVTGFGTSTDIDGSFAIINGQRVLLNHYINGVQLVEIRAHDIVVEYKGERRILADELQK